MPPAIRQFPQTPEDDALIGAKLGDVGRNYLGRHCRLLDAVLQMSSFCRQSAATSAADVGKLASPLCEQLLRLDALPIF
jgi:hypothetical protein